MCIRDRSLDNIAKDTILKEIRGALAKDNGLSEANQMWNEVVGHYSQMGHLGPAPGGKAQLEELLDAFEAHVTPMRTADPDELTALGPVVEALERHVGADGTPLYRIGFRPDEADAWGPVSYTHLTLPTS